LHTFRILLNTILFHFLFTLSLQAQTLHALILTDSVDETIGPSVKNDRINFKELMNEISVKTGMYLNLRILDGSDFKYLKIKGALDEIRPGSNDTVFIYFSSHGYRTREKKTKWPFIGIPDAEEEMDQFKLYQSQFAKKPRLLIIMSDACNSYADVAASTDESFIPRSISSNESENYKALFLRSSGGILTTSSKPGQFSRALEKGGAYSIQFLSALKNSVKSSKIPKWNDVMKNAHKVIAKGEESQQDPIYELFSLKEGVYSSNVPTPVAQVIPIPNKLLKYVFDHRSLIEVSKKSWKFNDEGKIYLLQEYERDANFISMYEKTERYFYALDHINKILYYYDEEAKDWILYVEGLK